METLILVHDERMLADAIVVPWAHRTTINGVIMGAFVNKVSLCAPDKCQSRQHVVYGRYGSRFRCHQVSYAESFTEYRLAEMVR